MWQNFSDLTKEMNVIRASDSHNLQLENQAKMAEEMLNVSEETFTKLRSTFSGFSKKTAKYMDASSNLASVLKEFCSAEKLNLTLKMSMDEISSRLQSLSKGRSTSTIFLDEEVLIAFDRYKAICKNHRISMKNICSSKERESANRRRASIRGKYSQEDPNDADQPCHMQRALEQQALEFEKKKLVVLKTVLQDFIRGEMYFHAQAVQNLSEAFSKLSSFNVDEDFANFKEALQETRRPQRQAVIRPSNALVLRQRPQSGDKLAFLDDESLRRINDRRCSERSSLATVPSEMLISEEDDQSNRLSVSQMKQVPEIKSKYVTDRRT